RARGAYPNTVAALVNYIAKNAPLFDRDRDQVDRRTIIDAWLNDRRVYHVIVCPNDGHRIDDMAGYGRVLLAAWEQRTGPLEWVASAEEKPDRAHPDGNRHLHVLIRGVRDDRDLFFGRTLTYTWLRRDAVEVTTDRLGYMDERERRALTDQRIRMRELQRDLVRGADRGLGGLAL
ncbi:MAG TPA: hypothetical protein VFO41_09605, partial [Alphaproteobacteria bacterium]|nr:hypothetical protein [Alphaproteobacteria bacterium]